MQTHQPLILIVDDNMKNLQVLGVMLEKSGYDIALATSGRQALDFVDDESPDLVLLDVMMPEMDGFEVCRRLKARDNLKDLPVIFLTAKTESDDIVNGFRLGAVDYVTKPFNREELEARVKTHLELKMARERLIGKNRELAEAYEKLETMARCDPLTGLSNRRDMNERLEHEYERVKRGYRNFCIVLADIDNFKSVNDTYGHDCGDHVLIAVSDIIRSSLRKQDLVARWGGEEFLILLPATTLDGALQVAEKVRVSLENQPISTDKEDLRATMTFGVAPFDPDRGIDKCIVAADRAMYLGKQEGRNRVVAARDAS